MAMYDWNHNGKKDMADSFIEYQIYKDVTGQKDEPSYTPSRGYSFYHEELNFTAFTFCLFF